MDSDDTPKLSLRTIIVGTTLAALSVWYRQTFHSGDINGFGFAFHLIVAATLAACLTVLWSPEPVRHFSQRPGYGLLLPFSWYFLEVHLVGHMPSWMNILPGVTAALIAFACGVFFAYSRLWKVAFVGLGFSFMFFRTMLVNLDERFHVVIQATLAIAIVLELVSSRRTDWVSGVGYMSALFLPTWWLANLIFTLL